MLYSTPFHRPPIRNLRAILLCIIFTNCQADARTLYVNASHPNNKGNGLSAKKAKKTIQAAINIAKNGDTILVYPGTYTPIKTNNKKITIKSVKGRGKTAIMMPNSADSPITIAMLGKPCVRNRYYGTSGEGPVYFIAEKSKTDSYGSSTCLYGFSIDGRNVEHNCFAGVTGGTVKSCTIRYIMSDGSGLSTSIARQSKLVGCTIAHNRYGGSSGCFDYCSKFNRCKIVYNSGTSSNDWTPFFNSSTLVNCLIAGNSIYPTARGFSDDSYVLFFDLNCLLLNCTVADNYIAHSASRSVFCWESRFYNCILRNNTDQRVWAYKWEESLSYGLTLIHNCDLGYSNIYKNTDTTNRNPKFTAAYKLKKDSYCINSGKLTAAQKKLVGKKDLAGKKRIRGKAIDRGCYEY